MTLADKVAAALQASVLPSVIARGGEIRVLDVEDGTARLEVTGSPGAALPLAARIEALIRHAVPEVTRVVITGPAPAAAAGLPGPRASRPLMTREKSGRDARGPHEPTAAGGDVADLVRGVLERDIKPVIAAHRGHAHLVAVEEGWVRLRLEGGCQGCSLAEVTLRQGIEPLLRARVPGVVGLTDVTDHEAGREPFFSAAKR
ncbi:NifU family protein [Reyranella sp.]|uniref:NifU family protein n=1 Tax=Reyranella sp. TaxID=1929291 RepID=UPI003D10DE2C